jgi:hypothetical protein
VGDQQISPRAFQAGGTDLMVVAPLIMIDISMTLEVMLQVQN